MQHMIQALTDRKVTCLQNIRQKPSLDFTEQDTWNGLTMTSPTLVATSIMENPIDIYFMEIKWSNGSDVKFNFTSQMPYIDMKFLMWCPYQQLSLFCLV